MSKVREWKNYEISFLMVRYSTHYNLDLAMALDRSVSSICKKGHELRLSKNKQRKRRFTSRGSGFKSKQTQI